MNIPIVFEDQWLMILDKPSGLLSVPALEKQARTLTSIINDDLKSKSLPYRAHPCHRLDKETSGLIIFAKGKSIQKKIMDEFKNRLIQKTYIAFVQGRLRNPCGAITKPIDGLQALTKYALLEQRDNFAVVKVFPLTGRKNQIRIHFKALGNPIVGESKFAFRKDFALRAKRTMLHAYSLDFKHPVTGKQMHIEAPLPLDMEKFLKKQ